MIQSKHFITFLLAAAMTLTAMGQAMYQNSARVTTPYLTPAVELPDTVPAMSVSDSLLLAHENDPDEIFNQPVTLPDVFFMPPVFDTYTFYTPLKVGDRVHSGNPAMRWVEDYEVLNRQIQGLNHNLFYNYPELVHYNLSMLPVAPPKYEAVIDPSDLSVSIRETVDKPVNTTIETEAIKKRHWISSSFSSASSLLGFTSLPDLFSGNGQIIPFTTSSSGFIFSL